MVSKHRIQTDNAPQAVGCYSQAIRTGNWVFLSGQIGLDPKTMQMVDGDVQRQIEQILRNMKAVLNSVGGDFSHIVKLTVFLTDMSHYVILNDVMKTHFVSPYPARSVVEVSSLPKNALVEIEAVSVI
jgi:reactive intermediate/imine deaminase